MCVCVSETAKVGGLSLACNPRDGDAAQEGKEIFRVGFVPLHLPHR